MTDSREQKYKLRKFILNKLKNQNQQERITKSNIIETKFISSRDFLEAQTIMLYAAMPYEVEPVTIVNKALHARKKVLLQRMIIEKREIIPC